MQSILASYKYISGLTLVAALAAGGCGADAKPAAASAAADASAATDSGATADTGTAADTAAADGAAATPDATGDVAAGAPYGVGVIDVEVAGADGRKLPATVWYPIPPGATGTAVKYLGAMASPGGAIAGAEAAKGPFPLVAFSHGHQGLRQQSVFLTEALAAHGYVTIAPDHVGNTFYDYDDKLTGAMAIYRPIDLKAAIDRMLTPNAKDPPWFAGLVDKDQIAVSGHSFGGYTALAVAGAKVDVPKAYLPNCDLPGAPTATCKAIALVGQPPWDFADSRVKLALPLAHCGQLQGFGFVLPSMKSLKIPAIIQAATGDTTCTVKEQAQPAYDNWGGPKALVSMLGGNHFSYSDLCSLPVSQMPQYAGFCKGRVPDLSTAHSAIVAYTLAACDGYLKGKTASLQQFAAADDGVMAVQSVGIAP